MFIEKLHEFRELSKKHIVTLFQQQPEKKEDKQVSPSVLQDGLTRLLAGLSVLWSHFARSLSPPPPRRAGRWAATVAICLYFSNLSTGHCKVGTAGTSQAANSVLSPKCLLLLCPDPGRGRGWHGSLADGHPPFGSSEKERQDRAGRALGSAGSTGEGPLQGFGFLRSKPSLCRCPSVSVTSLFPVPSRTDLPIGVLCFGMGLETEVQCIFFCKQTEAEGRVLFVIVSQSLAQCLAQHRCSVRTLNA